MVHTPTDEAGEDERSDNDYEDRQWSVEDPVGNEGEGLAVCLVEHPFAQPTGFAAAGAAQIVGSVGLSKHGSNTKLGEQRHSKHVTRLGRAPAAVVDTQGPGFDTKKTFLASAKFPIYLSVVNEFKIGQAADLLGVSTDTLRRWADAGRVDTRRTEGGHRVISGTDLAAFATELSQSDDVDDHRVSARNRFVGLVTRVKRDSVMAQVEIQSGPHRIVSLISTEAVDDLGLEPGVLASAVVKSTNVVIELP